MSDVEMADGASPEPAAGMRAAELSGPVSVLLARVAALVDRLAVAAGANGQGLVDRLQGSVVGPLTALLAGAAGKAHSPVRDLPPLPAADEVWELAKAATVLCASAAVPVELLEATGGLQDVACTLAGGPDRAAARTAPATGSASPAPRTQAGSPTGGTPTSGRR